MNPDLTDAVLRARAMLDCPYALRYDECPTCHRLMASHIALRDAARAEQREADADAIPTNWTHPLLTGPSAALPGAGPWGCPDIERLLLGLATAIRAQVETR